jgi:hypothetical protein
MPQVNAMASRRRTPECSFHYAESLGTAQLQFGQPIRFHFGQPRFEASYERFISDRLRCSPGHCRNGTGMTTHQSGLRWRTPTSGPRPIETRPSPVGCNKDITSFQEGLPSKVPPSRHMSGFMIGDTLDAIRDLPVDDTAGHRRLFDFAVGT